MAKQIFEQNVCQTTCPYCGVGCGVDITTINGVITDLNGSKSHPANLGKLCVKGANLLETISHDGRLLTPQINSQPVSWGSATSFVADKFNQLIEKYGPNSVALYVSGQILTEDYYVANKLIKGYIGSANIDTNSRLCMSSAVAAYKRSLGSDTVPCTYEDIEITDLLVLIGSNAAWTHPVLFQRMQAAKDANPNLRIVVIDPRKTATAEFADLFIPLKAGSDVSLFNGLLHYLITEQALDNEYIERHCQGFDLTQSSVEQYDLCTVSQTCGVAAKHIKTFYKWFAQSPSTISFYSQGVNQSLQGVDKCNAIINCHLATGKIGKAGSGPFSITGQPNAMGGREVGGLANMLAAHMNIEDITHRETVQTFWDSPTLCQEQGLKAVDMFNAIKDGKIKAVWIMATNPLVSLPNRNAVIEALENCELVVVSDCVDKNDTLAYADVAFPATTWAEKNGMVTNSERRISRQRGIISAPGEARHDWQIICDVAKKMGFETAFNYEHPVEIFREHAALSGFNNGSNGHPARDFDISGLQTLTQEQYDNFTPTSWPVNDTYPNGCARMFNDGLYFTPSGKATFIAVEQSANKGKPGEAYPLLLNSGRYRDQWHSMTRTGRSFSLAKHTKEPFLSIHPTDAKLTSIEEGQLVGVTSEFGHVLLPCVFDKGLRRKTLFAPIHWTQQTASNANISNCFSQRVDPISGQPDSKYVAVKIHAAAVAAHIHLFTRQDIDMGTDYWVKAKTNFGYEFIAATGDTSYDPLQWCRSRFDVDGDWAYYESSAEGTQSIVCLLADQLQFVAFFQTDKALVNAQWIDDLFNADTVSASDVSQLLSRSTGTEYLNGKIICSCFRIGENQILQAMKEGADSIQTLGNALKCGTNCGSCKGELQVLLNSQSIDNERFLEDTVILYTETPYV
ncbi:molybdopterin-dependent oxidoreductase [Psychrobium sp. nBUS_13]|uniref:nitrate reductase n=1 Tax=Psychrobium sp. nBUS_13 TaxID=3395319 RepID=UPI003EC032B7